jgi:tetratricopeptide (TPR) repeat protein
LEADTPDIQFRLGVAYRNAGQPEPARTLFASLIESGSNYPELFLELGTLYEELNLVDEAIKCYDVAQQRGAMNAETTKRKLALTLSR